MKVWNIKCETKTRIWNQISIIY